jgi:hypothetical protein
MYLPIPSVVVILNPSAANKGNRHYIEIKNHSVMQTAAFLTEKS